MSNLDSRSNMIVLMMCGGPAMLGGIIFLLCAKTVDFLCPLKRKPLPPYKQQVQIATAKRIREVQAMPAFGSTGLGLPAHIFKEYKDLQALDGSLYRESQELA